MCYKAGNDVRVAFYMTSNGFAPVYGVMVRSYIGAQAESAPARRGDKVGPYSEHSFLERSTS